MSTSAWPIAIAATIVGAQSAVAQTVSPIRTATPLQTTAPRSGSPLPPVRTLYQALQRTYQTSPTLMSERAALRRLDSGVALARSEGRPQLAARTVFEQDVHTTRNLGLGRDITVAGDVEQILFTGGRIRNTVKASRALVSAGRYDLRATEGEVLVEATTAYADLLRDREIRALNIDQVRVLEANLKAAQDRFRVNDLTKADVAQSEARLLLARSNLALSQGRLQASEENFERVVGARADILEPLPPLPPLPISAEAAEAAALDGNLDLAALVERVRAARLTVEATKGERQPVLSAFVSSTYANALGTADRRLGLPRGTLINSATDVSAGMVLRWPLYQGGAVGARVRQAADLSAQQIEQAIAAERLAVASARAAFAGWRNALNAIDANTAAIAANQISLDSVKIEQTIGARDLIDVLNAEQELLGSRVTLASVRRDAYVFAMTLLNIIGRAQAAELAGGIGPIYDPNDSYRANANNWSDWSGGAQRPAASTRTVPANVASPVRGLSVERASD
ncbi:TolC family protein [Sphingomonas sp.]|jgi:outer membrane protein|uniref:TolC family protein n=1 Tax=Sphingomonas sp. TaxID=28214 RepID=UPI0035C81F47